MLQNGKITYSLETHVTDVINPIDDIKEKVQLWKSKVVDLISRQTIVRTVTHTGGGREEVVGPGGVE